MNVTDVRPAEPATTPNWSMVDDHAPGARPVPSFDYSRVVETLAEGAAGWASPPHMMTIAAQLAMTLRAQIGSGELAPHQPIPGESMLMQQYGVARETVRRAVRALVEEGLAYLVEGCGAYVAERG